MMVITFETKSEEEWIYSVVGDRLVSVKHESKSSGAGMGEKGESKITRNLRVQAAS